MRYTSGNATSRPGMRLVMLGVVVFISLVCIGAAAATRDAKPELAIGWGATPITLDPAKDGASLGFLRHFTSEALITHDADGRYSAGLAAEWHFVKAKAGSGRANKDFELTLRHNARYSDGTLVTAASVKAWLLYMAGAGGPQSSDFGPFASVETTGKWSLTVHLKSPNPNAPTELSNDSNWGFAQSPSCVADPTKLTAQTCGAGRYMLSPSQTVANDHYTLVPNPYYYDKSKQYWSRVVIKIIPSPSSQLQALETGQVDVTGGDPSTAKAAATDGFTVLHAPSGVQVLAIDVGGVKVKALADARVRQALNYAINRKLIAAAIVGKYGSPTDEPASADGYDPRAENAYNYNPTKAKALLGAAGYANGLTIDVCVPGFTGSTGTPMVQAVASQLQAVGVTLHLTIGATLSDYIGCVLVDPSPLVQIGIPYAFATPTVYTTFYKPGSLFNRLNKGWNDRQITAWWIEGSRAPDPSSYWKKITDRSVSQAYFLPVLRNDSLFYVNSKRVQGIKLSPFRYYGFLATEWSPK